MQGEAMTGDRAIALLCLVAIPLVLLLGGCASAPYWTERAVPVPIMAETVVADVTPYCGPLRQGIRRGGCFVERYGVGFIYLQAPGQLRPDIRVTQQEFECARKHERAHSTHTHDSRAVNGFDCAEGI